MIDFFENKKSTYKDEMPSITKSTREYYTSQVIECFQLLIDNLKLTINKKEEENNNLLYQYRPPLHKGTKCDMRFKSSLNSARLNLLNPYK